MSDSAAFRPDRLIAVQPTPAQARLPVLDALRGFALFGVLIANTQHFSGAASPAPERAALGWPALDRGAAFVIDAVFDGKFYSLFALLFGVGCALQWQRWQDLRTLHRRRMLGLFALGLLHLCCLWYGDILTLYALTGLVLVGFRDSSPRKLLKTSLVLFALPVLLHAVFLALLPARLGGPDPKLARFATERLVASGGYLARVRWNVWHGIAQRAYDLVGTGRPFKVLATCLLGVYVCRTGLLARDAEARLRLHRVLKVGLLLGVPLNLGLAVMMQTSAYERLLPIGLLQPVFYAYGVPALALSYASAFALCHERPRFAAVVDGTLGSVGRMSLSNYVAQSLLGVLLYDSFGAGLFGRLGTCASLALATAIFATQIGFSRWWLARWAQGPLESAWRALTYGQRATRTTSQIMSNAER